MKVPSLLSWMRLVTLIAVGGIAVACSPAPEAVLAVGFGKAQKPQLIAARCDGGVVAQYAIHERGGSARSSRDWIISNNSFTQSLGSVEAFSSPQGWTVASNELSSLRDGRSYAAAVSMSRNGKRRTGKVEFTGADLAVLGADEVLVSGKDGKNVVMKRDDFIEDALPGC